MKVGFIGVGMMGGPMCRNLIKHGHHPLVYDLSADALARVTGSGAEPAGSPGAVAGHAEIVFTSLPMPADVEQVILGPGGVAEGARPGSVIVDLSTNAPATVQAIGERLAGIQVDFIDAPVSGGVDGAENATLAIMCGGSPAAFDRARPLLECMGANVFLVGALGAGSVAKLCNNMVSFANLAVACESLMLATRAGLDPGVIAEVLQASSGASHSLRRLQRKGLLGDFDREFTVELSHKDLSLALDLGRQTGTPLAYGAYTYTLLQQARARGWGGDDVMAILRLLEQVLGTEVRA